MNDDRLIRELIEAAYNSGYYSGKGEDGQPHHTAAIKKREQLRTATLKRLADLRAALEMVWATKESASYIDVKESGITGYSFYLDESQCAQIRAALAGAGGGGWRRLDGARY